MSPPWAFGRNAPRLARAGYDPIPISCPGDPTYRDAGKQPAQRKGWTKGCPRDEWPRYAECGVGLLTSTLPALDIDTLDQELGDRIQAFADRYLGDAPVRYGQAPKRLMPFRLVGEPFPKLVVTWHPIPGTGDEGRAKPPGVEILARDQQFVALGIHPITGQPYRWERDPDLSIPRAILPPLDQPAAAKFMRALVTALRRIGADIITTSAQLEPPAAPPAKPPRQPPPVPIGEAERIRSALAAMGNRDLHYDQWIKVGLALKAALPGADGEALWLWWSGLSAKNDPAATQRKWATFKPNTIGAGTIFYSARRS